MSQLLRRLLINSSHIQKSTFKVFSDCLPLSVETVQSLRCYGTILSNRPFDLGTNSFLKTTLPILMPSCGLKYVGIPKLRCKYCYRVYRDGRLYIECKSMPRHKQTEMRQTQKNRFELVHATQSKIRPW